MVTQTDIKRYKSSLKMKKKPRLIDEYQAERNKALRDTNIAVFLEKKN